MTDESNKLEQTQPIKVNTPNQNDELVSEAEAINDLKAKSDGAIPEWLMDFASQVSVLTSPIEDTVTEDMSSVELEHLEENPEPVALGDTEVAEWKEVHPEEASESVSSAETLVRQAEETKPQNLLEQGQYQAAAELLREQATTPETIDQALRQLRSHLILKAETAPLWNLYDELKQRSTELEQADNTISVGD